MIFETALRCGKSRKHDVHGVILGTQQNGGSSIAIQVEEVSIESVASNLSNNPAALNAKPDKLRAIKKPTGWNSFLKAAKGSCCKYDILNTLRHLSCFSAGFNECVIIKLRCRDIILHLWFNM